MMNQVRREEESHRMQRRKKSMRRHTGYEDKRNRKFVNVGNLIRSWLSLNGIEISQVVICRENCQRELKFS